jgi:hypothetical protein
MKPYLTTILLILTLPLGELHTFWSTDTEVHNWIWKVERPMTIGWNIKFAVAQVNLILYFLAWLLYVANRVNKTTVIAFLFLAILDTVFYFYDYKTGDYGKLYFWFIGFWLIVFYWTRGAARIKTWKRN